MSDRVENVIFEGLIGDIEYARKVLPFIEEDYFSERLDRLLFAEIKRFFTEHNTIPTKKILGLFFEDRKDLKQEELDIAHSLLESLDTPESNKEWLEQRTEKFCKDMAIYNAITKTIAIYDGKNSKYTRDAIPSLLSDALSVSFDKSVGHNYFNDSENRYESYHLKEDRLPFDLEMFNKITKGGLPKRTLSAILASTGCGKSLFMCHHAASTIRSGKNALYITLEMAEVRIAERIDCNLLNLSMDELSRIDKSSFMEKLNSVEAKSHGKLVIKEYPTAGAHVGHFKALLDELEMKQNFKPDIIYIDYINICASQRCKGSGNFNSYTIIKSIAEELRGLAVEYDVPILSATQTTRQGSTDTDVDMTDTSESFGLPATLDFYFALIRTEELDELGQLMVKQLKNRFGDINFYKRFVIGINLPMFKLYNVDNPSSGLSDAGRDDKAPPVFDKSPFGKSQIGKSATADFDFN